MLHRTKYFATQAGQSIIKTKFCFIFAKLTRKKQQQSITNEIVCTENLHIFSFDIHLVYNHKNYFIRFQFAVNLIEHCWINFCCCCQEMLVQLINFFNGSGSKDIQFVCVGVFSLSQPNHCIIQFIRKHFKCFSASIQSHLIGYEMLLFTCTAQMGSKRNKSNQINE